MVAHMADLGFMIFLSVFTLLIMYAFLLRIDTIARCVQQIWAELNEKEEEGDDAR